MNNLIRYVPKSANEIIEHFKMLADIPYPNTKNKRDIMVAEAVRNTWRNAAKFIEQCTWEEFEKGDEK